MNSFLILGHRGSPEKATENTIRSFELAFEDGADGIELDVRLSANGDFVLSHDDSLARVFGREILISQSSTRELTEIGVATLRDLFGLCRRYPDKIINFELKLNDGEDRRCYAEAFAADLAEAKLQNKIIVSSFDLELIRVFSEFSQADTALLCREFSLKLLRAAKNAGARYLHPHYSKVGRFLIVCSRLAGLPVNPYTVDDPAIAKRFANSGANAIITNLPGVMAARFGGASQLKIESGSI